MLMTERTMPLSTFLDNQEDYTDPQPSKRLFPEARALDVACRCTMQTLAGEKATRAYWMEVCS
jgi:hypothetical protein